MIKRVGEERSCTSGKLTVTVLVQIDVIVIGERAKIWSWRWKKEGKTYPKRDNYAVVG